MKIFAGSSNKPLGERIAHKLGVKLSEIETHIFPDGERRIKLNDSVVEEEVVVVQSTATPVDENYMELFFLIDAAKRNGASRVTAVVPYFGYQRQDHVFRDGEAVSLSAIIKMLEAVGADRVLSVDMHSIKIPEMFHVPFIHVSALSLFAHKIQEQGWCDKDTVLVTPDMGGIRRIRQLSEMLGNMPYACVVKNRDLATGVLDAHEVQGTVKKRVIIVDDMISSGKTIVAAVDVLAKHKAQEALVFATHAVFSEDAPSLLENSTVSGVFVTDTVFVPKEKQFPKLDIISASDMIAADLVG